MTIAALQAEYLCLTELSARYTQRINVIDARVMQLTYKAGGVSDKILKFTQEYYKKVKAEGIDNVDAYNSDPNYIMYQEQQTAIQAQNKLYETQKNQIQTLLNAATTRMEVVQKKLEKNTQSEFKGIGG